MSLPRAAAALALAATSLAGCVQQAEESPLSAPKGGHCGRGPLTTTDVLDCMSDSVALVETRVSGGSGLLLDGGYIITNAHVVDPYDLADVTFSGRDRFTDVPVVGVDALADIAVLGPVDVSRPPLALASGVDLERGSEVYLVGYPGEFDADPEATISRGVLSRVRRAGEFQHRYLQTDASIGGGQSGGALVDDGGAVIGVSGLSFAEQFALALDGEDVAEAVDRILAGDGDPYSGLPDDTGTLVHALELQDELDQQVLLAPALDEEVTLTLEISDPDGVAIDVTDLVGDPLLLNEVALQRYADFEGFHPDSAGIDVADPVAPGVYEVELPAHVESTIAVSTATGGARTVTIRSSEPLVQLGARERRSIAVGDTAEGFVGFLDAADVFVVDLTEGDRLDLTARSPQGDMALYIRAPGAPLDEVERFDNEGGGLYGLDAEGTVTASSTGSYTIVVRSFDGVITGYRLSLHAG